MKFGNVLKIYELTMDAYREDGSLYTSIYRCCNGERKTAYKSTWEYIK